MPREAPYLRVADDLRARVLAGEWEAGERIPSRATLASEYKVSRNVTERAADLLIDEGLLEGRAGSGTFVRDRQERLRITRPPGGGSLLRSVIQALQGGGEWFPNSEARTPAPSSIARRLGIQPGDRCVRTVYTLVSSGERLVPVVTSWEPMAVTDGTPVVLPGLVSPRGLDVVERMRMIGVTVARVLEVPRPGRATQEEANLLGAGLGDPVLRIERTHFDDGGRPVETADVTLPDARWEIAYELGVDLGR